MLFRLVNHAHATLKNLVNDLVANRTLDAEQA
jgi:hypothetical protein